MADAFANGSRVVRSVGVLGWSRGRSSQSGFWDRRGPGTKTTAD